ncbi:MBL fold metallo-hydrolase [Cuneatibacter caecimuris]|uniref:Glyoxylase-like metal-dependent hydrolase (Beta-lactamase superfamily II) n=1 Tax=Cuneatibacter caecimuris TaxID=1796618 RepID=A0A4Q7PNL5_9FIRM|nr:MBL fold metallo-hydrolase [Cuneatibacter caecimuris]RZT00673.1 glyoxylase-like metal-dependent hydrolase (beta-lactamase superfamily II) [Cuneatibacter caecimuris]
MGGIQVEYTALGMCGTNCYLIYNNESREAVLVDPADQPERLEAWVRRRGVTLTAIWLTHGHFDHMLAADELRKAFGVKIYAMEAEKELLGNASMNLSAAWAEAAVLQADVWLKGREIFPVLGTEVEVLSSPGHTPGGCCYYFRQEGFLISGDTLFRESLGRTDFPGSSTRQIIESIRELLKLPESVTVYPGHGEETTIGYEKLHNPVALYRG